MTWIGTAGWSIPRAVAAAFGEIGSHLHRYSAVFSCVEINTSFYRPHRTETYARWAASVPSHFRFAVKMPRVITHDARLRDAQAPLMAFREQVSGLDGALGPILIQLPPSLKFDHDATEKFLDAFRTMFAGEAVLEPRHLTWFEPEAENLLRAYSLGRVAADPAFDSRARSPGGWSGLRYWRLHGSPRIYYSAYGEDRLRDIALSIGSNDWCILDNTASGAAFSDALLLQRMGPSLEAAVEENRVRTPQRPEFADRGRR